MRFRREQSSPNITRSRYYRMNPHFRLPQTPSIGTVSKRTGLVKHHGRWFLTEVAGCTIAVVVLLLFLLFPTPVDIWIKRHFPEPNQPRYIHLVQTFHSDWTSSRDRPSVTPSPTPEPADTTPGR